MGEAGALFAGLNFGGGIGGGEGEGEGDGCFPQRWEWMWNWMCVAMVKCHRYAFNFRTSSSKWWRVMGM